MTEQARFSFGTIREALDHRAATTPDALAYAFLRNGEKEDGRFSFAALRSRAERMGRALIAGGAQPGDRILLMLPQGLDYVTALYACFYTGFMAVPTSPPSRAQHLSRLQKIARDCSAAVIVSDQGTLDTFGPALCELSDAKVCAVEGLDSEVDNDLPLPELTPDSIALLQYTSGSAGHPKGVMVTHRNLCVNQTMLQQALGTGPQSTTVSWLPLFHDMGLIMGMMHPLFVGAGCYLMTPLAFLQKPQRWLSAISTYKAEVSGAPNFAYDLAVTDVPEADRAAFDFTNWKVAFNAAETIRPETLQRFVATYAPNGFQEVFANWCYGLAEATLIVTGGYRHRVPRTVRVAGEELAAAGVALPVDAGEPGARLVASCGRPLGAAEVVIAHPETCDRLPVGEVGEVWLAGEIIAPGYWNNPEATEAAFNAYLTDGAGPYLRTGDIGFMSEGELFLTSRVKDLIIVRGRNYSPADLEFAAERAHPHIRENGVAAFTIAGASGESVVIAAEVTREGMKDFDAGAMTRAIRAAITAEFDLRVAQIAFVRRGKLPRTTSGKIQRPICREDYLAGALARVDQPEAA